MTLKRKQDEILSNDLDILSTDDHDSNDEDLVGPKLSDIIQSTTDSNPEIGPVIPSNFTALNNNNNNNNDNNNNGSKRKKKASSKPTSNEKHLLENLPCGQMYEKSFMHRDAINFTVFTKTDFLITTSQDGHLKFWKKTERGIEFIKDFRSHVEPINGIAVTDDGSLLATISLDNSFKVYDIINFDMINIGKLDYTAAAIGWVFSPTDSRALLAISDLNSHKIYLYDGKGDEKPIDVISSVHNAPVHIIRYNPVYGCVVSVDSKGIIEYWTTNDPYLPPSNLGWQLKADTDLFEYAKLKVVPSCLEFSPDFSKFVTFGIHDRIVRIFNFHTGTIWKKYIETIESIKKKHEDGKGLVQLDEMEFGRRIAIEDEVEKSKQASTCNVAFDESGNFLLVPSIYGVKIINMFTNKLAGLIGSGETTRILNISLYQGSPSKKTLTLAMAASDNPALLKNEIRDPMLACTAFRKSRFYLFSRREPSVASIDAASGGRDTYNEKPSKEEQALATQSVKAKLANAAIIRTTFGDIHIKFFPEYAPKAVENFVTHAKTGYYNNLNFHRVVKGFMIQTGDPLADGTGGESIWGVPFEDEFHPSLRHDVPFSVSMANRGPNTNGSQFFITTVPTPWLDDKHTIFGRVTAGFDTVTRIESVPNRKERPYREIKVFSIEIK